MRVGVVGCGYWGIKHVRVASTLPSVTDVVIIDPRREVREAAGRSFPATRQRPSLAAALDEVDAVIVATPPETHFDLGAEAIAAGKHVLIEKPMTTSAATSAELVDRADDAGVTLAVGHTFAHNPAVAKLAEIIAEGHLGALRHLDAARLNLGLYRPDVNVLWDLAAHDVSITTALLGRTPTEVSAWGSRHTQPFAEDVANLRMSYDDPAVVSTVRVSWLDPIKVRRMTVVGSAAMAVYDDLDQEAPVTVFDRGIDRPHGTPTEVGYRVGDIHAPRVPAGEPLALEVADFVDAATTGRSPRADGRAGLAVVAVLEASDRSLAENGAPIAVPRPALHRTTTSAAA